MDFNHFKIVQKSGIELAKGKVFDAVVDTNKYNVMYTLGSIDMLDTLLTALTKSPSSLTKDDFFIALKSFKGNETVKCNVELEKYLNLLIVKYSK